MINKDLKMKKYSILFVLIIISLFAFSQGGGETYNCNYVRTFVPIGDNATTVPPIHNEFDYEHAWSEQIVYFDGLGRPIQEINVAGSPSGKDIIQPIVYDKFGRTQQEYLPFAYDQMKLNMPGAYRTDPITEQKYFYQTYYSENPNYTFGEKIFDGSPLNKIMKQGFPGEPWNVETGRPVEYTYSSNVSSTEVFKLLVTENNELKKFHYYSENKLHKTITQDENHKPSTVYTNFSNRTLAQISSGMYTYYAYDDLGNLRYVIPPLAYNNIVSAGSSQTFDLETDWIRDLCYYYQYDNKNRLIKKKLPGKEIEYLIYDNRNRLVLTQDGNQRLGSNWLFTKYDAFNRPIMTGNYNNKTVAGQEAMQQLVDLATVYYEEFDAVETFGYTNDAFPDIELTGGEIYTVTFYDNYDFFEAQPSDFVNLFSFRQNEIEFNYSAVTNTKGKVTTTIVNNMSTKGMSVTNTDDWEFKLFYYDKYGNSIQSIRNIAFQGTAIVSNKYNFTGQLIESRNHLDYGSERSFESISELQTFTYDHAGRLLNTTHQLNQDTAVGLSNIVYDELGLQTTKKLHLPSNSGVWKQLIDYDYNIRGWLTSIDNDMFSLKLGYDITESSPQFNGNISEMLYSYTGFEGKYMYTYDGLNRLTGADHSSSGTYSTSYTYDNNGNITTLTREGIDNLSYTYNGNQLVSVNDQEGDQFQNNGFSDNGSFQPIEFIYDNNGNMLYDLNKTILGIDYNYLNLPEQINIIDKSDFNNVLFQYDATGQKKVKQTRTNGKIIKTINYIGNFVYENGVLKYILTSEGRIVPEYGKMVYQYFIKDHLGNNRVMFDQNNMARQLNNYYPFGMLISRTNHTKGKYDYNRYLYNGKELQDDFDLDWYDYGARMYDAQLGRWHVMDPAAELARKWSPYQYAYNNPVKFIDNDGRVTIIPPQLVAVASVWIANKGGQFKNFWNKQAEYTTQTYDNNGNYSSANSFDAATHGMSLNKIVADVSETIQPVIDNIDMSLSIGKDIKIKEDVTIGLEGEFGFISGTKSFSMSLPDGIGGVNIRADADNNLSIISTFINDTETIGKNNTPEYDKEATIPLGPLNINFKANVKEMKKQMSSQKYQKTMKGIEDSYDGGGVKLSWHNREEDL